MRRAALVLVIVVTLAVLLEFSNISLVSGFSGSRFVSHLHLLDIDVYDIKIFQIGFSFNSSRVKVGCHVYVQSAPKLQPIPTKLSKT